MNKCKDCKHLGYANWCCNPKLGIDVTDGQRNFEHVRWVRSLHRKCGPNASWFEKSLVSKIIESVRHIFK